MGRYAVYYYDKFYKNWRVDNKLHSLEKAREIVRGLRENNNKAYYKEVK